MKKELIIPIEIPTDKLNRAATSIAILKQRNFRLKWELSQINVKETRNKAKVLQGQAQLLSLKIMEALIDSIKAVVCPAEKYEGLECDGMTRVLSYLLKEAKFSFQAYTGRLKGSGQNVLHYWIEIPYQAGKEEKYLTIDLRARMWLSHGMKDDDIPHGVFKQEDYPKVMYKKSKPVNLTPSRALYGILTR